MSPMQNDPICDRKIACKLGEALTNICNGPCPRLPVSAYVPAVMVWVLLQRPYFRSGRWQGR